jgi:hypothetical protein
MNPEGKPTEHDNQEYHGLAEAEIMQGLEHHAIDQRMHEGGDDGCDQPADAGVVVGGWIEHWWTPRKEGSTSFLKKRSKKLLILGCASVQQHATATEKFFPSFFKKEVLAYL